MKEKKGSGWLKHAIFLSVIFILPLFCSEKTQAAKIKLAQASYYDGKDAFVETGYYYHFKGIKKKNLKITSKNQKIVKVTKENEIYAKKQGRTTITIKYKTKNKTIETKGNSDSSGR